MSNDQTNKTRIHTIRLKGKPVKYEKESTLTAIAHILGLTYGSKYDRPCKSDNRKKRSTLGWAYLS